MKNSTKTSLERRVDALFAKLTQHDRIQLLAGADGWNTVALSHAGVPAITVTDGPHGVRPCAPEARRRQGECTCFPPAVGMSATWNPALIESVGSALAEETRGMGCDILLGPCVNIARAPLAGRNFEAYGEDPVLSGHMGAAWVRGLQKRGVGASLKHFACNNQEFERFRGSSEVDERTLREIFLPAFERIVKETQPWTVMCAYNKINGVYASANRHLLTEILRKEWGFKGAVISDWGAVHGIGDSVEAGLDLEMPGPAKYRGKLLEEVVRNWQVDGKCVDECARRIVRLVLLCLDGRKVTKGAVNAPAHARLARKAAEESITLLKNVGGILPLKPRTIRSVAVIGPNADVARIQGGGSAKVPPPYAVSPLEGLRARLGENVRVEYTEGCIGFVDPEWLTDKRARLPGTRKPGFAVEYFNGASVKGRPAATSVSKRIEFWSGGRSPAEGISAQAFGIRWTCDMSVDTDGDYMFSLGYSGNFRITMDGKVIMAHTPSAAERNMPKDKRMRRTVALKGRRIYRLCFEHVKPEGEAWTTLRIRFGRSPETEALRMVEEAVALARKSDVAVLCVGMPDDYETEGHDRPDMDLPGPQTELIRAVLKVNPRTVVVMFAGAPVHMPWADEVPAIVMAYYPGQECGHALARILCGDANPSGKLPVTLPHRCSDNPSYPYFPGNREVLYGEGVFVGYRYYDKRGLDPLFAFGHGLSYTTFAYSGLTVSPRRGAVGDAIRVSVRVRNTGKVAGSEVVQVYVADEACSVPRPPKELKAFAKVSLRAGETKTVRFALDRRAFAFYDVHARDWVVEPGRFGILVGSSSRDIRVKGAVELA